MVHCLRPAALLPASLWVLVAAGLHNSLVPEDPYAFPKYRVAFLNGLPVLNETAQRWLESGLRGGEMEFLDQPWEDGTEWRTPPVKSIEGGSQEETVAAQVGVLPLLRDKREAYSSSLGQQEQPSYKLELMKMGPRHSYLCLIPPPPVDNTSIPVDEPTTDITPVHTWSLLQPLSGSCLYV